MKIYLSSLEFGTVKRLLTIYILYRPPVSGIHGGADGAYSIALSGGYDDNVDLGEGFTYTGEGTYILRNENMMVLSAIE